VSNHPISAPSKPTSSITKLFNKADHVEKETGCAIAIRNNKVIGLLQNGKFFEFSRDIKVVIK
jgi:hypothetical protein